MAFAALMYHSLSDGRSPDKQYPRFATTRERFGEQMRWIKGEGFQALTFSDLQARLKKGAAWPDKFVMVTVDDGHKSGLDMADVMSAFGVRGTFFLTQRYCMEREDFFKPGDIRRLAVTGFDFGTHGVSHRSLADMPLDNMEAELRDSKKWLEDILGKPVRSMSLPAGRGSQAVLDTAWKLGYQLVGNSDETMNQPTGLPAVVNRFVVCAKHDTKTVKNMAYGSMQYIARRRLRQMLLAFPKRLFRTYNRVR